MPQRGLLSPRRPGGDKRGLRLINWGRGEVYHQAHCNFFASDGMPYPDSYTADLWSAKRASGEYAPTGCPESGGHSQCSSWPRVWG